VINKIIIAMKKIELYLMYINKLKSSTQSIDIYFNDLKPEFVVKIIDNLDCKRTKYFRNGKLKKAIDEACLCLLNENE